MRWENGRCALLSRHMDRLAASAAKLAFGFDRNALIEAIEAHAKPLPTRGAFKVRLVLDPQGGCAFSPAEPLGVGLDTPFAARLWPTPVRSSDPWLRHKTTNRDGYNDALHQARAEGFLDAIFSNERGMITEGAIHSVFVRHGDRWRTPPLSAGILPGVYRGFLLDTHPEIREEDFTVSDLYNADEIWLTNAVHGVRRVTLAR